MFRYAQNLGARRGLRFLVLVWICLLGTLSTTRAQEYPAYNDIYVNDFAGILDLGHESILRRNLTDLRENDGVEFTVVTIRSMNDYGHDGNIEPFATGLFNFWGVGNATRNDGIMLLVAVEDRVLRVEVGSGYGPEMDLEVQRIIDRVILPEMAQENYATGIMAGVDAVIADLRGIEGGDLDQPGYTPDDMPVPFWDRFAAWFYAATTPVAAFAAWVFLKWRRRRPRICPKDGTKMARLGEDYEDSYLTAGQQAEESLKSVDYDVWECPTCQHHTVETYRKWFSRHGACRSCNYKTVESDRTTLESPTYSSTGRARVDYSCQHCSEAWSATEIIPKKTRSSSSSSSSSSFGGGSSSGGGGSGSW